MSTEEIEEFELDGEKVEIVWDFVFLGVNIEDSGTCKGNILRRLALGRAAMIGLNKIWKDKYTTITTTCRIVNALVFSEEELTALSCGAGEDSYEHCKKN